MKRTMNRLLIRFSFLCLAIILGVIAVAQAQRGMGGDKEENTAETVAKILPMTNEPIPFQDKKPAWSASAAQAMPDGPGQPISVAKEVAKEQATTSYQEAQFAEPDAAQVSTSSEFAEAADAYHTLEQVESADAPPTEPDYDAQLAASQYEPSDYDRVAESDYSQPTDPQPAESQYAEAQYAEAQYTEPEFDQPETTFVGQEDYALDAASRQMPAAPHFPEPRVAAASAAARALHHAGHRSSDEHQAAQQFADPQFAEPQYADPQFAANRPQQLDRELPSEETQFLSSPPPFDSDQATIRALHDQAEPSLVGNGKPGTRDLEGAQTPSVSILKKAPDEIQVNEAAEFIVTVRNDGSITARDVTVRDQIPAGTELANTSPPASHSGDELIWQVGELHPGEEQTVSMTVIPKSEGEIGSVATVYFAAAASAKSLCTRPQISVEHAGPKQVLVGEDVIFKIQLHNPGTGIAHNVVIEEDVPEGLRHSAGNELEYPVGDLQPGETRVLELTLSADKPGHVRNLLLARADANLAAQHEFNLEVIAPLLQVGIQGPRKRYLEREATFDIAVQNPGTANAHNIELVAHLPRGLKFDRCDNQGEYDSQTHAVHWTLAQLPANEMGTVRLTAIPTDMGDQKMRVEGKADMNLSDSAERVLEVDGLAALLYTVKDLSDPIEVGRSTVYEITVVNQGSKSATNLMLAAQAPVGMVPVSGDGPTRATVRAQQIRFEPLPKLAPQSETKYRINVNATQAGEMRLTFYLKSDEVPEAITKEESTHVYADE